MVYRRKRKRTFKRTPYRRRRTYKRRRRTYKRKSVIPRGVSGVPPNCPIRMRYCKEGYLGSTSGILNSVFFAMNDIWDPEVAAGGHQPMGFDQMAALYNRYLVLGSKITITFYDNAASHSSPAVVGACMTDGTVAPYIVNTSYIEAKRGQWRTITGGARIPIKVTCKYSPKKYWGIKDVKDQHEKIGGAVVGSPDSRAYCMVWVQCTDGGTQTLSATYVIDYLVQFTEPKDIAAS